MKAALIEHICYVNREYGSFQIASEFARRPVVAQNVLKNNARQTFFLLRTSKW